MQTIKTHQNKPLRPQLPSNPPYRFFYASDRQDEQWNNAIGSSIFDDSSDDLDNFTNVYQCKDNPYKFFVVPANEEPTMIKNPHLVGPLTKYRLHHPNRPQITIETSLEMLVYRLDEWLETFDKEEVWRLLGYFADTIQIDDDDFICSQNDENGDNFIQFDAIGFVNHPVSGWVIKKLEIVLDEFDSGWQWEYTYK